MNRSTVLVVFACVLVIVSTVRCGSGGDPGTIEVITPGMSIELRGRGTTITVKSGEKQTVASGTYKTKSIRLVAYERASGGNIPWTIEVRSDFGRLATVDVAAGETTRIEAGPPFLVKAKVTPKKSGANRVVEIDMEIIGKAGEKYWHEIYRGRKLVPSPKCQLLDESGKVISKGTLDYG